MTPTETLAAAVVFATGITIFVNVIISLYNDSSETGEKDE